MHAVDRLTCPLCTRGNGGPDSRGRVRINDHDSPYILIIHLLFCIFKCINALSILSNLELLGGSIIRNVVPQRR